jgi:UDP-galactopyranose mutase
LETRGLIGADGATLSSLHSSGSSHEPRTLICFSHLRWDFVFQRPQHLMTRFAREMQVVYWEEPLENEGPPRLEVRTCPNSGVVVATPHLSGALQGGERERALERLLEAYMAETQGPWVRWYYTPMMLGFSRNLAAVCTVYDCMDELANFKFAPPELTDRERELMDMADVVFTGGYSLYEAKQSQHRNIHPFPSSVDQAHFARARTRLEDPADQAALARPRLGFYGVVDERMDRDLLAAIADARPDWNLIIAGPVVKIDPCDLPKRTNLHYVGSKTYEELPSYLGGWDVALMPFAINESTRFISPTKTPEYLAGGKPVVSTPITDVVRHYGELAGVFIASCPSEFIAACERALALEVDGAWRTEVDQALALLSWDQTFSQMRALVAEAVAANHEAAHASIRVLPPPSALPAIRPASRTRPFDYLIVGAGFAGSVLAERLASQLGKRVLLVDRRPHIGGNAFDEKNAAGVLMHRYGPHIFHTNSDEIAQYLSRFTRWRPYEHRVLASVGDKLVPMPINRTTLNTLYGLSLQTEAEVEALLRTSEDVVVSRVGRELYETFFRGYTRKQWGIDPSELDKSVTARVPTRANTDDRYFTDTFQAMPLDGYTRMFENMLDQGSVTLEVGVDFEDVRREALYDKLIFTGPIDEFFDHRYGPLPYRSLAFDHRTLDVEWFQPVGVVNYPDAATPHTRITEYKHLTGQTHPKTTVTYEYPQASGDPYYPIPRPENQALYKRYEALALATPDVHFVGRLATYRYYNMDQVVGQALATFRRIAESEARATPAVEIPRLATGGLG